MKEWRYLIVLLSIFIVLGYLAIDPIINIESIDAFGLVVVILFIVVVYNSILYLCFNIFGKGE